VRDQERVNVNVPDREVLPRVYGFHFFEALPKSFGKNPLHRSHRRLSDVQRRFPQAKHLRQAVAMIRMFVSDENSVEVLNGPSGSSEAGKRFALAESAVHEESGPLRLEQRNVPRAPRRQYGYP